MTTSRLFRVAIVLVPGFSLMSFSSLVEPMRGANRALRTTVFEWVLASPDGGIIFASNGMAVGTVACADIRDGAFDLAVVCGGQEDETFASRGLHSLLRHLRRRRITIGSVSTATFILARAGILDGRRCTTHWAYIDTFRDTFPEIEVTNELFVMEDGIFTCAGGIAALDVMLVFIRGLCGGEVVNLVSENFIYGSVRDAHDSQRMALGLRHGVSHPNLMSAMAAMEANTELPLRLPEIARSAGISQRHLERLFRDRMGVSASRFYVQLRLEKARRLLRNSSVPVYEIAVATGFSSAAHFSRAFRAQFGRPPSAERRGPRLPAPVNR